MSPSDKQRDITFRYEEIKEILAKVKAGDSCSVVGIGAVGKSNLLRHLLRPETQKHHLGDLANELKLVLVDPNNMLDSLPLLTGQQALSPWAGYEIMTHRLYKAFYPFTGFNDEDKKAFQYAYDQLHNGRNPLIPHIGLRYLEAILEILLGQPAAGGLRRRIAFVFDEFEGTLTQLPVKFFQALRGIRDDYKYNLTYITFTRRPIPQLIAELGFDHLAFEPFVELFTGNTLYLGPYSDADAKAMLDRLSERKGVTYPPSFRNFLLRVSGNHAGLLRASFDLAGQIAFGTPESEALHFLANSQPIQMECQTIWDSLSKDEQIALKDLIRQPVTNDRNRVVIALLQDKHLLTSEGNNPQIVPILFREYVRQQSRLPQE
ncbi:MAG: hypothetical protein HPY64_00865 [Anaerolineae bacterium]|nr:hypothetical protein [Anaerolineae bacterium]